MKLEERIIEGNVHYLSSLKQEDSKLIVEFLGEPERADIVRRVIFSKVRGYRETWHDRDEDCLEMLLGIEEELKEAGTDYLLHTDQRAIWFSTKVEPVISGWTPA